MEKLDLLCKLEKHHNSLDIYNRKQKELKENIIIDKIGKEIQDKEKEIEKLIEREEDIKIKLRKIEKTLKEYNYKFEEVEEKLYSGETKDITQLEKWNIEKNSIKNILNDTETKTLELMEKEEDIGNELDSIEKLLKEIRSEYESQFSKYKKTQEDLNKNIEMELKNIKDKENLIDTTLLKRYDLIRKNNGTAIAQINAGICSGCNTGVSTHILEEIKKSKEIIYCEFCGRILSKE